MKKSIWGTVLKVIIAVATAIAGVLGLNACGLWQTSVVVFISLTGRCASWSFIAAPPVATVPSRWRHCGRLISHEALRTSAIHKACPCFDAQKEYEAIVHPLPSWFSRRGKREHTHHDSCYIRVSVYACFINGEKAPFCDYWKYDSEKW